MGRKLALISALLVIVLLAALTIAVLIRDGLDIIVIISLVILGVLASAVFGALKNPPDE
jgi:hypothetical protein